MPLDTGRCRDGGVQGTAQLDRCHAPIVTHIMFDLSEYRGSGIPHHPCASQPRREGDTGGTATWDGVVGRAVPLRRRSLGLGRWGTGGCDEHLRCSESAADRRRRDRRRGALRLEHDRFPGRAGGGHDTGRAGAGPDRERRGLLDRVRALRSRVGHLRAQPGDGGDVGRPRGAGPGCWLADRTRVRGDLLGAAATTVGPGRRVGLGDVRGRPSSRPATSWARRWVGCSPSSGRGAWRSWCWPSRLWAWRPWCHEYFHLAAGAKQRRCRWDH